ncbi:MAG TPA: c-type cytochrome [Vicinamibacterales bacterium]|jgi:putative heme-binding domain-containing protein|nr:c-type cytochrome [Vicinamibacterales bacterium]
MKKWVWVAIIALPALVRAQQDHAYTSEDIQLGSRLYGTQCATCHGATGDTIAGVNLRRGQFPRPMGDDDIRATIMTGVPNAGMPPFALQPAELTGLVAYIRAGFDVGNVPVRLGSAPQGKTVFDGKGSCGSCHRVEGKGPRVAPDLTDIGTARNPQQLYRSVTEPTTQMMPINRPVQITMKDGKVIKGRRLNEDTYTVQVITDQERLMSIDRSEIKTLDVAQASTMPTAAATGLTPDNVADLVAYLVSLRGQR